MMFSSGPVVVGMALILGVAAQGFINNMASGDRGLGAFLQDGRGLQGSGFSTKKGEGDSLQGGDPLPWLKLPELGFVEVAGQTSVPEQLEQLRQQMNVELDRGNVEEARKLRDQLEAMMKENGFEYQVED